MLFADYIASSSHKAAIESSLIQNATKVHKSDTSHEQLAHVMTQITQASASDKDEVCNFFMTRSDNAIGQSVKGVLQEEHWLLPCLLRMFQFDGFHSLLDLNSGDLKDLKLHIGFVGAGQFLYAALLMCLG